MGAAATVRRAQAVECGGGALSPGSVEVCLTDQWAVGWGLPPWRGVSSCLRANPDLKLPVRSQPATRCESLRPVRSGQGHRAGPSLVEEILYEGQAPQAGRINCLTTILSPKLPGRNTVSAKLLKQSLYQIALRLNCLTI